MNKATQIEIGDTVRIIETRQFSHDHLEGETREVLGTIRRHKSSPARVSIFSETGASGLIIDLDVAQVEKVDPCVDMTNAIEQLPQFEDRVEVRHYHEFGEVKRVDLDGDEPSFFVRLDDGLGGWFTAPELRVCGGAPASDPDLYR